MISESVTRYRWEDIPKERVSSTLERRLISGERAMLAQVSLKKGGIVPRHQHVHEQFTYIIEGALRFSIGDDGREELTITPPTVLPILPE